MPTITSTSLAETTKAAKDWLKEVAQTAAKPACVVALYGDLGSGKTTFTQVVAKELGVEERVASPTFVIEKVYHLSSGQKFQRLIHIDCYRLDSPSELEHLGWAEIVADQGNLIMVEWADKIASILPPDYLKIKFKFIDEQTREISY